MVETTANFVTGNPYPMDILNRQFPGLLRNWPITHANELYCEITSVTEIVEVCRFIDQQFKAPLVTLFANDERCIGEDHFAIYYVFSLREISQFLIVKAFISAQAEVFPSLTPYLPAANLYEREIQELYGLQPEGHPDPRGMIFHNNWPQNLYPLRRDFNGKHQPMMAKGESDFKQIQGSGVFEIPVGPVHAGIIEPGHFRFSVAGEPIINLEAQLYYVHKGIEKLCQGQSIERCFYIAERISGDETYSNSLAYCQAIERMTGIQIPERAEYSRVVFAELERLVSHLGDLGGLCVDVAYGFAAYQFKMLRVWTYQSIEEMGESRFLRSVNRPGGLRKDFLAGKEQKVLSQLQKIKDELMDTVDIIKANSFFIDRVEHTGVLTNQIARDLNAVGPAGRASGVNHDVRKDHPYAAYGKLDFTIPEHANGDVNCRMNVKITECFTAIDLINQAIANMSGGAVFSQLPPIESYQAALGYTESPRGENIHWIMTGPENTIFRYKIRTPSFCNWPALCYAVRGNIVPDFPLINKSFNLSYAGNDL
ncbi:MAG TPA: pyridine nucleotide-disulfide oxidoreductase [Firmicutes bacterium]|jgi:Ni,Fe-hydrogenase III large subunit/Ni,Fe-hydrogenase III component G|nr:pyridine nucleotide-disulfide oxidoreductase [Bacillota bacterium]